ncbi:uncharacterized protein LOC114579037, partial [Dendrobium catenatum]|uniref:uncharacterized protein LOC114579037 n=1 Tax=Dendrobium catenatum TaxID=906689 RepID=UPI00109FE4BF
MRLEIEQQVISEVKKLIDAGFIRKEKYPSWLASVIPVKKKSGQIRVCIDYKDLNKACPKDGFPLPIPEHMVDIASEHEIFSFMDDSSGYNQIKMTPEDEKFTAFKTPIGVFCYKVMPFGLKNAGATYQRAMTRIFDDLIHQQVECYIDDLVVKSHQREYHLHDLRIIFERLRHYDLKMNPLKCDFGVTTGKFLGFVVRHRRIEIDPSKIKAIFDVPPPKSLTQLRSLQVLAATISLKPLILYTAALDNSLGALMFGKMVNILNQFDITFIPLRAIKDQVVADFLAAHPIPAESPLNDDLPDEQIMSLEEQEGNTWELYFDGAASSQKIEESQEVIPGKAGIRLVFITPEKELLRYSYHLLEPCTNNKSEYEDLITGLELAISMEIWEIKIFGDSQLIINQGTPNSMADALAKLAKELACIEEESISIEVQGRKILSPIDLEYINKIFPSKGEIVLAVNDETVDWRKPFIDYLQENKLPQEKSAADQIKRRALSYTLINNTLYRRYFDQLWLRCFNKQEAQKIITE